MIDPLCALWIVDFLVAQPSVDVDDRLLQSLLAILPFPSASPLLRKRLLLRRLRSDYAAVSERSLETLELLEDLDDGKGATLPALAAAYAAVAVNCAVRRLKEGKGFEEAVRRIWRRRIGDMVRGGAGLQSAELVKWKKVLEKALRDESVRKLVRSVDTKKKAEVAVKAYIDQASQEIGRPMLEVAAGILSSRRSGMSAGSGKASAGEIGVPVPEVAVESIVSGGVSDGAGRTDAELVRSVDTKKKAEEAVKAYIDQASQEIGRPMLEVAVGILSSRRSGMSAGGGKASAGEIGVPVPEVAVESIVSGGVSDGAGRTDADANAHTEEARENKGVDRENGSSTEGLYPCDNIDRIPSPDVVKVKEALRTSCANLHAVVKDPLQDSIAAAAALLILSNDAEQPRTSDRPSSRISDHDADGTSNKMANAAPTKKAVTGIVDDRTNEKQARFNLMDRNPTAHTHDWGDESDELTSEGSEDASKNIRLPSPRKRKISTLNSSKDSEFTKRRKKKWWTLLEENVLREAVAKYGAGHWKFILNCHRTVFEERTEVDLKDKWRNLTRYK